MVNTALILGAHFMFQTLGAQFTAEHGLTRLFTISAPPAVFLVSALTLSLVVFLVTIFDARAFATTCSKEDGERTGQCKPGWEITSTTFPTDLAAAGGTGVIEVNIYAIGAEGSGSVVTVTDELPEGIVATRAGDRQYGLEPGIGGEGLWNCTTGHVVTCVNDPVKLPSLPIPTRPGVQGTEAGFGSVLHIAIMVEVETERPGTLTNRVHVAGGGALAPASTSAPITINSTPASSFGFQDSDGWFSNPDGTVDTQAGSHPYEFTYSFDLNTNFRSKGGGLPTLGPAGGEARDLTVNLPPGFVGNPTAVPECTRQQFEEEAHCPPSTQVGIDLAGLLEGELTPVHGNFPVYNLKPPPGIPAQFGFQLFSIPTYLDAGVRSGGDYGLTVHGYNVTQKQVMYNRITFWGEPSDPTHNEDRSSNVELNKTTGEGPCRFGCLSSAPRVPFLTLPTSCGGPQAYLSSSNTWETTGLGEIIFESHDSSDTPAGFTGCDRLGFGPSISVAPDTSEADTPAGLTVDVRVPQEGLVASEALATSNIKDTTVVLPKGVVINPGRAVGLAVCRPGVGPGTDDLPLAGENGETEAFSGPPECPLASQVGTVEIETPLLAKPLQGDVYVLQSSPPELKLLLAASGEGVNIKLVGDVHLNEQTGQLTTTFSETPELPFTNLKLSFNGGPQAALDTPTQCETPATESHFTPWSTPAVKDVFPSSSFVISNGAGGGGCPPSPLPFAPSLIAGPTTDQAGGFTDFSLLLQRPDDQQRIAGLRFKAPAGLTGELAHVPLCTNAQAESNTCPKASKIGHTVVESGPGPYPLVVPEPGQEPAPMYLTESYEGAPFGLSIVVPLHVGPFVLPTQRVRAKIEVDPHTTQLTVTTNPLPQEVAGVPTDVREINAEVEHPEFMINPTNCDPSSFAGTATGALPPGVAGAGATAAISSRTQVGSCQALKFEPKFAVTTSGKTSKANGASLTATVTYPSVPQGTDADIALAKVELPKQLPSRLTTLQKACTAAQFNANPAGCPTASFIGHATVHTPLLPVPLTGPAIFVSHGSEAFPSLTLVLQGDGVTVDLVGTTFISKKGVTSTTFKTVPDAPFSTFQLTLPEGKYSALTGLGNLCTQKLSMPTEFVGQNGAVLKQSTKIAVTGCGKTKPLTRAQKLAKALKACHSKHNKKQRATCEATAHRQYGPAKKTKKKKS